MSDIQISLKAREALRHIRNYVMHSSRVPSVRELTALMNYKSPRSAMLLMEELGSGGFLEKKADGSYRFIKDLEDTYTTQTVAIPLVGSVTCGTPMLAIENVEAHIPVSISLIDTRSKYFLLKTKGDSMDLAGINDGDLILVQQRPTADNGQNVVALIDDEATVKEFRRTGNIVTLMPKSSNPRHQPIIVTTDMRIQGLVVAVIPKVTK
jgi:repressor LexA